MLVKSLKESQKENRVFRAEVVSRVELFSGLCRILLKDERGDCIYCLVQGMQWFNKIKDLTPGQKILLAPSKILPVPLHHKTFYAPEIEHAFVSDLFFQYNPHDLDLGLSLDQSVQKFTPVFEDLSDILHKTNDQTWARYNISAVILDFAVKTSRSSEHLYSLKLIDHSTPKRTSITFHLYLPKRYSIKGLCLGDIIVAQNLSLQRKPGSVPSLVHNRYSGSLAIFSSATCRVIFCLEDFTLSDHTMHSVCHLQAWLLHSPESLDFPAACLHKIAMLNSRTCSDIVLYLTQTVPEHPENSYSTLIFSDCTGMGYLVAPSHLIPHISPRNWIRICSIRSQGNKLDLSEFSSFIIIPEWNCLIRALSAPCNAHMKEIQMQYRQILGENPCMEIKTAHSQKPCIGLHEVLDLQESRTLVRIKAIIIEFNPRVIGMGVVKTPRKTLGYTGILKAFIENEILDVLVCGKNSEQLYQITEYDEYPGLVKKIAAVQEKLLQSAWVEIGIRRIIVEGRVVLVLSETEIKTYD